MKLSTISLFLILFFAILLLVGPIIVRAGALEDCLSGCAADDNVCIKNCECAHKFICIENPLKYKTIEEIIPAITNFLKTLAIGIGGIMIIWSGIQIMTGMAQGKEQKTLTGKKTLMWTVIGIAIVISIDFIVGFIRELIGG